MVTDNEDPKFTAFTITVDAKHGTTTGISAGDRATTLRKLANPEVTDIPQTQAAVAVPGCSASRVTSLHTFCTAVISSYLLFCLHIVFSSCSLKLVLGDKCVCPLSQTTLQAAQLRTPFLFRTELCRPRRTTSPGPGMFSRYDTR